MTVIMPFGRAVTRQLSSRSNQLLTRLSSPNPLIRASWVSNDGFTESDLQVASSTVKLQVSSTRGYATDTASKPRGRPKAHTGRTPAKKTSSKSKVGTTKTKRATRARSKAATETKPKPAVKSKPRARKVPSKAAVTRARIDRTKDLKAKALLTEPKQLPSTTWLIYIEQNRGSVKSVTEAQEAFKDLSERFKHLSPEEHEQLNHTANQNKIKNRNAYKQWVESHTPAQVKTANSARKILSKEKKVKEGKKKPSVHLIKDDRLVKQPRSSYSYFTMDRYASGDFYKMSLSECAKLASREWKALSPSEKKEYEDKAAADNDRYHAEHKTVYGVEPSRAKKKAST